MRRVLGRAAECGVAWRGVGLCARDNADRHTPVHPNTVTRADRVSKPQPRVRAHTSNAVTRPLWSQKASPSPPRLLFHSRLFSSFLPFVFSPPPPPPPPPPIFSSTPSPFFYHHHHHHHHSSSSLLQEGGREGVRDGGGAIRSKETKESRRERERRCWCRCRWWWWWWWDGEGKKEEEKRG